MTRFALFVAVAVSVAPAAAKAAVLYSGAGLPQGEGWFSVPAAGVVETPAMPGVELNTTSDIATKYGFGYGPIPATLSAAAGFRLSFTSKLISESHDVSNRAGFTAIIVTSNLSAVEFDFHLNEIYSQGVNFGAPGGSVAFDTTALTTYDVTVAGTTYTLSAGGTTLLTGPLLPYATYTDNPGAQYYSVPGTLFFGDNTTSASAVSVLTNVTVVPEPSSVVLSLMAIPLVMRRR